MRGCGGCGKMIEEKAGAEYDLDGRRHRCANDVDILDADLAEMDRVELLGAAIAMRRTIRATARSPLWDFLPDKISPTRCDGDG